MNEVLDPQFIEITLQQEAEALDEVLLGLSWAARRQLAQELDLFRLTVPQYVALKSLSGCDNGCTMRQLAASTQQVSPTMTGIVDRLVERGLVERLLDPQDRRVWRVLITLKGVGLLQEVDKQRTGRLVRILSTLEPEERCEILRVMKRYLNAVLTDAKSE